MEFRAWVWAVLILFVVPSRGDEAKDLQKRLQQRLINHVFMIRNFYGGEHLIFDAQGNLIEGAEPECWCAAQIEVEKLEINGGKLILRGPRVVGTQKTFFSKSVRQRIQMQLDIALDPAPTNEELVTNVLEKVFLTRRDDLNSLVPGGWTYVKQTPAATDVTKSGVDANPTGKAAKMGKGVTPPRAIYSPDPAYPDGARKKKREGTVVLWTVIDERGRATQIRVAQCLGAGLDEAAVEAVSKWRFEPAKKDGQPVAVQLNIEITFPLWD